MIRKELVAARKSLGLTMRAMAALLNTPYRTYQDWEAGNHQVPGIVGVAVRLLLERDKWATTQAVERATAGYRG